MENAEFKLNKPSLLIEACKAIDAMQVSAQNQDVQGDLYEYLLEQADRLRRTRRHALELTDTFLPAAFLRFFGDPDNPAAEVPFAELGEFLSFITTGSRGWAEHYAIEGSRFIRSLDVRMNYISDDDAVFVNAPPGAEAERTRVTRGDVLLTMTGSQIGRVAPVPTRLQGSFISQHVAILRLKPGLLPVVLSMYLSMDAGGHAGRGVPVMNPDTLEPDRPGPALIRLSDVEPREVEWLWRERVAIGKVTLIFGDPGKLLAGGEVTVAQIKAESSAATLLPHLSSCGQTRPRQVGPTYCL